MISTNPLWAPSISQINATKLKQFMDFANGRYDLRITTPAALHEWSTYYMHEFWETVWDFTGVIASKKGDRILLDPKNTEHAEFFPDAQLNFAENLLRTRNDEEAIVFWCEDKIKRSMTHNQLYDQVSRVAQALKKMGLQPGDRVAAMMPNMPETVVMILAVASLGGIWSSCSPDFGVQGALDRFQQIEPKLFIAVDHYIYKGKENDCLEKISQIQQKLPSLEKVVIVPYQQKCVDISSIDKAQHLDDFIQNFQPTDIKFIQLPFNHPLYIMFSSGTTGMPKCIIHGAGGTLLQHLKEHQLHSDIHPKDRVFYFTTCGWMMWNWQISALASGATLLLFDGSPLHPQLDILFTYADQERMTFMGVSAKYIDGIKKFKVRPKNTHNLKALRTMASTGGPLVSESFEYVYKQIKDNLCLASISGGTDIISCFVLGNPMGPVYSGEIQIRGFGMAVQVFNEEGKPVFGEKGELVCTKPFPSRPLGFWNDPDGSKYHAAYFARFPNVWCHGDFAEITEHDGIIIYGRSDAVLNPGGVRIGTAEIYRQVEQIEEVVESLAIGQDWKGDVRIILFVKLQEEVQLTPELNARIKEKIRAETTPRHVPSLILTVADIPRTKSGKIVELAVRDIIHGRPVKNTEALANPEALEYFRGVLGE